MPNSDMDHHLGSSERVAMERNRQRRIAKFLLKLVISCLLLGLLLWRVPLRDIGGHLQSFGPRVLLAALFLSLLSWGAAAARLWCLLPEFRYRDLLHATFVARFYATVLPGQIAGDVVKAYRLGRQSDRAGRAEAATAVDRGLGLFTLFFISAIAAIPSTRLPLSLRLFFVLGMIVLGIGGTVAASQLFRQRVVEHFLSRRQGRISTFVSCFSAAFHDCLRQPLQVIAALVVGILFHGLCIWAQVLLGEALGVRLPWADWTIVYAGVSLLMVLPISIAGLGLREGGYVGMLALFSYRASTALSLSFAILGISIVASLVGGTLELEAMVRRPRSAPKRRRHPPERT